MVHLSGQGKPEEAVLARMSERLQHRGPDSSGCFVHESVGLSFRRLKIMDPEGGDQPLFSHDNSVVLICNGEIFNHRELKASLQDQNIQFKTQSDVEVLIYLYLEQGPDFVKSLNGQFAFALYDMRQRRLMLARDHFGICPLFYTLAEKELIFASEIKALLQHPKVNAAVDLRGLDQIMTFPGLVSPTTLFQGIHSLKSGHYALVQHGDIQMRRYWDLDYPLSSTDSYSESATARKSDEEYLQQLQELMTRSIAYRLQSDVPLGCYLSGGLDSSLILGLASQISTDAVPAYSIVFNEKEQDESSYQQAVAAHCGTRLHNIPFSYDYSPQAFERMIYHSECAVKESYNLCSMALSQAVRDAGYKVMLSGEGADEFFAGYVGYRLDSLADSDETVADDLQHALERQYRNTLWGDEYCYYEREYHAFEDSKKALYSDPINQHFTDFNCINHSPVDVDMLRGRNPMDQRSYLDFKLRLSEHLISDHGDRMGMAHSVEVRYPFLDKDLVEFSATLPAHLKIQNGQEKVILRQLANSQLPARIAQRQKFGFHARGSDALLQQNLEWVNDLLSYDRIKRQGYFNPDSVEYLRQQYTQDGFRLNLPYEDDWLMIVLSFNVFLDVFSVSGASN